MAGSRVCITAALYSHAGLYSAVHNGSTVASHHPDPLIRVSLVTCAVCARWGRSVRAMRVMLDPVRGQATTFTFTAWCRLGGLFLSAAPW